MQEFDFCLITPSYAPDYHRCQLLAWSIDAFAPKTAKHYIIVPKRDLHLFNQIKYRNTRIITVESILPWRQLPLIKNCWFSFKHPVIRGWIIQQLIKLAAAEFITSNVFVFVDSDIAFIRPFDWNYFIRDGEVRLYRIPGNLCPQAPIGEKWNYNARRLLNLPSGTTPVTGYISQIMTWRSDNLKQLYKHIETVSGRGWLETVCSYWNLSEYVIYGVFVEEVLKASGHYYDSECICHEYWFNKQMSDVQLQDFFSSIPEHNIAVMISAKAGISVQKYENLVKNFHQSLENPP
ncbi:hypothetical protein NIES4071_84060 [Calothrix sp. NIES-4071]|nr:hypothetical protein NIES4071_84060 [Calothrix sp. NIES-4071]BAZ62674.1 hypothetical protein NIES4105_83990 [Calothrix sp. NIES-4105]